MKDKENIKIKEFKFSVLAPSISTERGEVRNKGSSS
jgi:hypothetical protein